MTEEETKKPKPEDESLIDPEDLEEEEEGGEGEGEKPQEKPKAKPEEQSREERAKQAQARREREAREREERIKREAYLKGKLDSVKVNPFTNEPIEDEYDLKVYEIQARLKAEGKDPLADLPRALAQAEREAREKAKADEQEKREHSEAIDRDLAEFRQKHPDVDPAQLMQDPDFIEYSDGKLGVKGGKSLSEIYEAFGKFMERQGKPLKPKQKPEEKPSAPSPNGGRRTAPTSDYSKMTKEQRIEYLKKNKLI